MMVTVIGNYLSPYVRKVLVCLGLKGIDYEIDPIIPFYANDAFTRLNPDRRVPVLIDGGLSLPESSVICEYLEERHPEPALMPADPGARASARALIAFADGRIGNALIWGLFHQQVIRRFVWNEPPDQDILTRTIEEDLPAILDFLENRLPGQGFLFGALGLADIAIATMFRNGEFVRYAIDAGRWPVAAAFVGRVLAHPSFARLRPFEEVMLRTPIARHREVLSGVGAPLTRSTFAGTAPRRGPLSV